MDERARALETIVTLVRQHAFTPTELTVALDLRSAVEAHDSGRRGILVRVLGVLGAIFVFAGIGVFIALQWDQMNSAARVVVTLGNGLVALALAVLASRDTRFEKATTPLFLMAATLEPSGMLVAFEEFGSGGDWRWASLATTGPMALQFGVIFALARRRSTLLLIAILFAVLFWWTAFDLLDLDDELAALILGGGLLSAAVGVARIGHRDITPLLFLLGAVGLLYGFFDVVEGTLVEILFLAVAAGFVYLSAVLHSRTLLAVATLAILAYTAYFTGEHFADSVGWPMALIALGLFMIGLSALALRIDRDYVRRTRPS
jgi:hypothetical protein